jgi:hypothetical protein
LRGIGGPDILFHRITGLSPHEYRQRFSTSQALAEVA